MADIIVTKMSEKFQESLNLILKEFSKCISEVVTANIAAINSRLTAIEAKLDAGRPPAPQPPSTSDAPSVSEIVAKALVEVERQREDVLSRSTNVIVSGLPLVSGAASDKEAFEKFCEENLTTKPRVVRTRRLGKPGGNGGPVKLCVTLDHASSVSTLVESAALLRSSRDYSDVYFNRDLTKAQAEAAYLARSTRRANRSPAQASISQAPSLDNSQPFAPHP